MKKVLIHLGLPKAASTTIQNNLFLGLHKLNLINFIGRAFESNYYGAETKKKYKAFFHHLANSNKAQDSKYDLNSFKMELISEKLNVYSEGMFVTNEKEEDRFIQAENLFNFFSLKTTKIEILFIIRSQNTWIYSYFLQKYRKMPKKKFSLFIAEIFKNNLVGEYKIFNIKKLIDSYELIFGIKNIKIIFYEDLLHNQSYF